MAKFKQKSEKEKQPSKVMEKLKWFGPFTYVDLFVMPQVKKISASKKVEFIVNVLFAALFAGIIYLLLGFLFGSSSPLVIVYSASMETTFYRGDVMGLTGLNQNMPLGKEITLNKNILNVPVSEYANPQYENGQLKSIVFSNGQEIFPDESSAVIVYPSYPMRIPIIHRTIVKITALDGTFVLTKGDNEKTNFTYDQDCGAIDYYNTKSEKPCITFFAIPIKDIQGVSFFEIPKVGCLKLWIVDDLVSLLATGKLPRDFQGIC